MLARNGSHDPEDRFPEAELTSDPVPVAEIIEFYRASPKLRIGGPRLTRGTETTKARGSLPGPYLCWSDLVRRQGLEPRTR